MRLFKDLTLTGQSRRLRRLAADALEAFGLVAPTFRLIQNWENATFRVEAASERQAVKPDAAHISGRYLLRIHRPNRRTVAQVASELAWLSAINEQTDVVAPVSLRTREGHAAFCADNADYPELGLTTGHRVCSLLRWVPGRILKAPQRRHTHMQRLGVTLARLHQHASNWQPAETIDRAPWDLPTIMGRNSTVGIEPDVWDELPADESELHGKCEERLAAAMKALGTGSEVHGIVHADLHFNNVLFVGNQARPIDFDDSGQSHYLMDLAVPVLGFDSPVGPRPWQDALLEGYRSVRAMPNEMLEHLDVFIAARQTTLLLWCRTCARDREDFRKMLPKWRERFLPDLRARL